MSLDTSDQRATLLIVDDEAEIAEELCEFLSEEGFRTLLAGSFDDACAKINAMRDIGEAIDLVVSDLRMPGGNGADLVAKAGSSNLKVPFILMSGHREFDEGELPQITGPTEAQVTFMKKPLDIEALLSEIERMLGL